MGIMNKNEFKTFMEKQVDEIKDYCNAKKLVNSEKTENEYAYEWIEKYSKEFRKKWLKYKN
jgi:hypothetical protein